MDQMLLVEIFGVAYHLTLPAGFICQGSFYLPTTSSAIQHLPQNVVVEMMKLDCLLFADDTKAFTSITSFIKFSETLFSSDFVIAYSNLQFDYVMRSLLMYLRIDKKILILEVPDV